MSPGRRIPLPSPLRMSPEQERAIAGIQGALMLMTFGVAMTCVALFWSPLLDMTMYPKKSLRLAA